MKKVFSMFLLIVYATVICGFTVNMHYCGGKLASTKLSFGNKEHSCPCGSRAMKKGCCKNKAVHFQLKAEQKAQQLAALNPKIQIKECSFAFFVIPRIFLSNFHLIKKTESAHPPPLLLSSNPAYLLNRVFRI